MAYSARRFSISSESTFLELIQQNPITNSILDRIGELRLPDAWLVSGCLFQTVWNLQAGENPGRAIKDYDIFYFDNDDSSSESEDRVNREAEKLFADLGCEVDVRNQARVHSWYESEFGVSGYPELATTTEGIDNFLAVCCMVAVRQSPAGSLDLYAPFGVDDVLQCVMRQNPWYPNAPQDCYEKKADRWGALWPSLNVIPFVSA